MADPTEAARHGWTAAELARRLGEKAPAPPVDPVRQRVPKSTLQAALEVHAGQQAQLEARGQVAAPDEQPFRFRLEHRMAQYPAGGLVLVCTGGGLIKRFRQAVEARKVAWARMRDEHRARVREGPEHTHLAGLQQQIASTEQQLGKARDDEHAARQQIRTALGSGASPAGPEQQLRDVLVLQSVLAERLKTLGELVRPARAAADRVDMKGDEEFREQSRAERSEEKSRIKAQLKVELVKLLQRACDTLYDEIEVTQP